jgi:hypothetical protein
MHIGAFLGATHVLGVQHFGEREANAKRHAVHGSEKSRGHGQRVAAAGGQIYVSDMCNVHDRTGFKPNERGSQRAETRLLYRKAPYFRYHELCTRYLRYVTNPSASFGAISG